jgi:hypothetical protein
MSNAQKPWKAFHVIQCGKPFMSTMKYDDNSAETLHVPLSFVDLSHDDAGQNTHELFGNNNVRFAVELNSILQL